MILAVYLDFDESPLKTGARYELTVENASTECFGRAYAVLGVRSDLDHLKR
jgi:hypothetical protein